MPSSADCSGIPWQTQSVIIWTITFCVITWQDGVSLKIVVCELLHRRDLTISGVVSLKDFVVIQVFITEVPHWRWFSSILCAGNSNRGATLRAWKEAGDEASGAEGMPSANAYSFNVNLTERTKRQKVILVFYFILSRKNKKWCSVLLLVRNQLEMPIHCAIFRALKSGFSIISFCYWSPFKMLH